MTQPISQNHDILPNDIPKTSKIANTTKIISKSNSNSSAIPLVPNRKNPNLKYKYLSTIDNLILLTSTEHNLSSDEEYFRRTAGVFDDDSTTSSRANSPTPTVIETGEQVKELLREDEEKVQNLVQASGGLFHEKPLDPEAPPKRKGMTITVYNEDIKLTDHVPAVKVPRPDESNLRRLTRAELMPPPSFVPEGYAVEAPISTDLVRSQDIIFLVIQKVVEDSNAPWEFPAEAVLDDLIDTITAGLLETDDRIIDTILERRKDPKNGITTVTLNTENLQLFSLVRKAIRQYTGQPGYCFETYSRAFFMKQNAVTIYITKQNLVFVPKAIMRFLFDQYPDMRCDAKFLYLKKFDTNREDWTPGKKSRIGDAIAVYTGPELLERISRYSEDHVFKLSKRWKITIKGGRRNVDAGLQASEASSATFTTNFARDLMANLSEVAAKEAASRSSPAND